MNSSAQEEAIKHLEHAKSTRHRGGDSIKLVTEGIRGKSASEKLTAVLCRLLISFWCFTAAISG